MGWMKKTAIGCGGLFGIAALGIVGFLAYAQVTAASREDFSAVPFPNIQASTDPAIIEEGRYLVRATAHCSQCHGTMQHDEPEKNTADVPLTGGMEFAFGPMGTTYAANLTPHPENGIGRRTDAELARTIQSGVLADGKLSMLMQLSVPGISDHDTMAIISYLRSLEPLSNQTPPTKSGFLMPVISMMLPADDPTPVGTHVAAGPEPTLERGKYLSESVMACKGCHTDMDLMTFTFVGPDFAGGICEPSPVDEGMNLCAPNLTNSPMGTTGKLDEEAFVARLRHGRVHQASKMPWENFSRASDVDLRSVYRYIKSQPGSDKDTGPGLQKKGWKTGDPA